MELRGQPAVVRLIKCLRDSRTTRVQLVQSLQGGREIVLPRLKRRMNCRLTSAAS
jgi:hypothetical protein